MVASVSELPDSVVKGAWLVTAVLQKFIQCFAEGSLDIVTVDSLPSNGAIINASFRTLYLSINKKKNDVILQ